MDLPAKLHRRKCSNPDFVAELAVQFLVIEFDIV
jgi:hypothetical protein